MENPNLDEQSYIYLRSIQKWTYFISIAGFVMLFLGLLFLVFFGFFMNSMMHSGSMNEMGAVEMPAFKFGSLFMTVIYLIIIVIYFIPIYFLFRFSTNLKRSLKDGDDFRLSNAFNYLNKHYTFMGVLMIIGIIIYGIGFIALSIGFMAGRLMY